jgi:hypothetical protein
MRVRRKRELRPLVEQSEDRCLLSLAVLQLQNQSAYNINFEFRWTSSSPWVSYTETPGQFEIYWTDHSASLSPQVLYNTTTSPNSQTTCALEQGYNEWSGTGAPPASAAALYQFQAGAAGIVIDYVPPPPTDAVVAVQNNSNWNITFSFRWSPLSTWNEYTELPGQYEIFWNTYSATYVPQVLYDTTTSSDSQIAINLAQGYTEWTGIGTPPESAAALYEFLNASAGVQLFHWDDYPTPTPTPPPSPTPPPPPNPTPAPPPNPTPGPTPPNPTPAPNRPPQPIFPPTTSNSWSGYVAATNIAQPQIGSVSAVYGSWIVPAVTGPSQGITESSIWVGIDGWGNSTVEQVGTGENVVNGRPVYNAWWEMYSKGDGQPEQIITSMTVMPGDSITASVQYIAGGGPSGEFYLSIIDNSRPNDSFSTYQTSAQTQDPQAQRQCAEWIVEAPTLNGKITTLANFARVTFTNASAVINGVSGPINADSWQSQAVNMASNGVSQDTTSGLTSSGTGFVVTYDLSAGGAMHPSSNHNKRLPHTAVGPTHRSHKRKPMHAAAETARNATPLVSGFRPPVRHGARSKRGFWNAPGSIRVEDVLALSAT